MGEDGQKKGTRKLPSANDVLVIAEERDLLDHPNAEVKLKRVDRISGGSWQDPLGWIGGRLPISHRRFRCATRATQCGCPPTPWPRR